MKKAPFYILIALTASLCGMGCSTTKNPPPKADAPWPEPLAGTYVCDDDTLWFSGAGDSVCWHFSDSIEDIGAQGSGTFDFKFDGKSWRYDASEEFVIYGTGGRRYSFAITLPGSCNDSTLMLTRFDVPDISVKEYVFKKQ